MNIFKNKMDKLKERFPDLCFDKFVYKASNVKSTVICKIHGEFEKEYSELFRQKFGCLKCFKNRDKVSNILQSFCKKHGPFTYKRYNSPNCKKCLNESKKLTTEEVKKILAEKYPDLVLISAYSTSGELLLLKDQFGLVRSRFNHLVSGKIPTIVSAVNKDEYAISEFNKIHNNAYTYPDFTYTDSKTKFKVLCKVHGEFLANYTSHKLHKCKKCSYDELDIGFTEEDFIKIANNRVCHLYLVSMEYKGEGFIKIGITSREVCKRLNKHKYELLDKFSSGARNIFILEKFLHNRLKRYKFIPKNKFSGHTECYNEKYLINIKHEFRRVQETIKN
jgi:hypothetical protein